MNFKLFKHIAAKEMLLTEMAFISELNMEAFIIENPQILTTDEYSKVEISINQLPIKAGRKSKNSDGRIDLIACIDEQYVAIIEIKNGQIKESHLNQLEDYLTEFSKNKQSYISQLNSQYSILGKEVIGIIIGTDISSDIETKLTTGHCIEDIKIIGITLNRYASEDSKEVYILSKTYANKKSPFSRIRFSNWDEFESFQTNEKKIHATTLDIAKKIHDQAIKRLKLDINNINYAQIAFTLNAPIKKPKRMFAFTKIYKTKIRVYMDYEREIPSNGIQNPDPRYPNSYYIEIKTEKDINDVFLKNLERSYDIISRN